MALHERKNMLTLPLEVGKKYVTREDKVVKIIKYDSNPHTQYPWLADNNIWYTKRGFCYDIEEKSLISDYIEESTITYDKKELLQAILNDKTLQFRVDENEKWQDVVDNDWVLRMIADKSKFCFRIKPDTIQISDGEVSFGDMVWWLGADGPVQYALTHSYNNWGNAKRFPEVYSIAEPEFEMVKVYKYLKES